MSRTLQLLGKYPDRVYSGETAVTDIRKCVKHIWSSPFPFFNRGGSIKLGLRVEKTGIQNLCKKDKVQRINALICTITKYNLSCNLFWFLLFNHAETNKLAAPPYLVLLCPFINHLTTYASHSDFLNEKYIKSIETPLFALTMYSKSIGEI